MLNKMKMMIMVMTVFAAMVFSGCQMATSVSVPEVEKTFYDELREIYPNSKGIIITIIKPELDFFPSETGVDHKVSLSYEEAYQVYALNKTGNIKNAPDDFSNFGNVNTTVVYRNTSIPGVPDSYEVLIRFKE